MENAINNQKPNENQCFVSPLRKTHASRNEKRMQKTWKNLREISKNYEKHAKT